MKVSRSLLISSCVATAILIWSAWSVYGTEGKTGEYVSTNTNKTTLTTETDNDGDGLPDWQEKLIGTDPYSADTDKDGVSDGEEVVRNKNPLIKGPDDVLDSKETRSEWASRDILSAYIGQDGSLKNGADPEIVAKKIISQGMDISYKIYKDSDILIDKTASAKEYGNLAGEIIANNFFETNVLAIFQILLSTDNPAISSQLDEPITSFENIRDGLLELHIPTTLSSAHLAIINNFERLSTDLRLMQSVVNDPIGGTAGLKAYLADAEAIETNIDKMGKILNSLGVTYTQEESGYGFLSNI